MPLPLDRTLKREIVLDGRPHTVTIGPDGVRLVAKGFRKGRVLSWAAVWALGEEGEAAGSELAAGAGERGARNAAPPGAHGTTPARDDAPAAPRRTGR